MAPHVAVFARERVCPPPKEVYALHRKLSGAVSCCPDAHRLNGLVTLSIRAILSTVLIVQITTCTKLRVTIPCRDLLTDTVANYQPSG
eukprot:SAG31_NODE_2068_length_6521_cov_6.298194_7_plen_88_part_00